MGTEHRRLRVVDGEAGIECRANHHLVEIGDDVLAFRRLSAPPGGDGGQFEFVAQQCAAEAGHECRQGPGLEYPGAEGVNDRYGAAAKRVDHPGRADVAIGAQLERIGEVGIETPPEHAHRLQPGNGANHDLALIDRQVFAFEQHEAEIARDIGVLEIGLVVDAWGQDANAAIATAGNAVQRIAEIAEEPGQPVHVHLAIDVR